MPNEFECREDYYAGYLTALQDVVREIGAVSWAEVRKVIENLTWKAIHDVIQEIEKEVKVPNAKT